MEIALFTIFVVVVIGFGIYQGNKGSSDSPDSGAADYFLAGRGLTWWLVGFSLIAANISTEQFVGMSGAAAGPTGLAIASYEWIAAITLVGVAFFFLPKFLRCGIYTIPEFLERRYGYTSRLIMAIVTLMILVGVPTAGVIFAGAKVISNYYPDVAIISSLTASCWIIASIAALYVFIGGLKSCAWTDLIWGSALVLGGTIVAYLAFQALGTADPTELAKTATQKNFDPAQLKEAGGWERFKLLNGGTAAEGGKLHMVRPADDPVIPWTSLLLGIWIPNFFYWGLNQYIMQRTLGSKSLAEGQKGIVFAAFLKLIIPFVVVIPGILAFNLYQDQMSNPDGTYDTDSSFALLLRNLIKPIPAISWFVLAALFGAVVSSLASMLNSASTIATMDLFQKARPNASQKELVTAGRVFVVIFVIIAALIAPTLGDPRYAGIFNFIQEFQGFVSPGALGVFILGFGLAKTPRYYGWLGIVINAILYGILKVAAPEMAFLNRMSICLITVLAVGYIITLVKPGEPVKIAASSDIELESSKTAKLFGWVVIALTVILYAIFW